MFLVNSCLGQFTAGFRKNLPLFRSYGVILPSSLTIILSLTLGYSPCPPVSVLGTGTYTISLETFLGSMASENFVSKLTSSSHFSYTVYGFSYLITFVLKLESNNQLFLSFSVTPSLKQGVQEYQPVIHRLRFSASP